MKIKELKKEFNLRNATSKTIENIMVVPFLLSIPLTILLFNPVWIVIGIGAAITQSILYSLNTKKWKVFLMDNIERLDEEEKSKVKLSLKKGTAFL